MRCPKCGYNSFDYLDACKKCGNDLTEQKLRLKFQGYVAPAAVEAAAAPPPEPVIVPAVAEAEEEAIDFGFDILAEDDDVPAPLAIAWPQDQEEDPTPEVDDPFAVDLMVDSGLSIEQPFAIDAENLPDDDRP